ncbi:MAG TPA: hypothetical protein VK988_11945 [Acidimicrobiales bacterium]|nr:hypothetical protein [Acidimicrobiales bacterium]
MALGHSVSVLGVSDHPTTQEGVFFAGSIRAEDKQISEKLVEDAHVIFTNVATELALLRARNPTAVTIQVCQNGPNFSAARFIDIFAMVGPGQFAYYLTRSRRHRHRIAYLPNVVPWESIYSDVAALERKEQVTWVGGWGKQGLRRWAKAMQRLLAERENLSWLLCGPSYSPVPKGYGPLEVAGISLPLERVRFANLTLHELGAELSRSRVAVASLGGEDGPAAYLDGHAFGTPVVCASDIRGYASNPLGTGLHCRSWRDCYRAVDFLLSHRGQAEVMGERGREFVVREFTERAQKAALERILSAAENIRLASFRPSRAGSDRLYNIDFFRERLATKYHSMLDHRRHPGRMAR